MLQGHHIISFSFRGKIKMEKIAKKRLSKGALLHDQVVHEEENKDVFFCVDF